MPVFSRYRTCSSVASREREREREREEREILSDYIIGFWQRCAVAEPPVQHARWLYQMHVLWQNMAGYWSVWLQPRYSYPLSGMCAVVKYHKSHSIRIVALPEVLINILTLSLSDNNNYDNQCSPAKVHCE